MRPPPATSTPRCCPCLSGCPARAPGHRDHPQQPRPLDRGAEDAAAARDQYAALLPTVERILGPEHPDTLATRADLARWTGEAGDAAAARDQYAALLPTVERVSGPEHWDTLTTRHDLANWTGEAGMRPPPGTSSPRCCPWSSGSWSEHPDTLITRYSLAYWTERAEGGPNGVE